MLPTPFEQATSWLLVIDDSKLMRPAVCLGEELRLISQATADNRADNRHFNVQLYVCLQTCMTGVAAPNWLLWASCSHFNVMHSLLNCLMTTAAFCSFVKTVTIRTLRCACSYALNKGVILLEGCHLLEALLASLRMDTSHL